MNRPRAVFGALLALAALDAVGYGMLAPVLPEIADRTGTGPAVAGALVGCFAAGQLAGFPVAARIAQRRGASAALAASLVLFVLSDLAFVLGEGLAVWFTARAIQGLAAGGMWIGVTLGVLERWPESSYPRLTGVLAAYSVGSVVGPAIGAVGGIRGPFLLHMALVLVAFAPLAALRTRQVQAQFGADRSILRGRAFAIAAASVVLIALVAGTIDGPIPLHLGEQLGQTEIAALYVVTAAVVAAGSLAAGRIDPRSAIWISIAAAPIGLGALGAGDSVPVWVFGLAVAGAAFGLCEAGAVGILLDAAGPERIVTAWVVWSQLWAVGYLVGPAAAGVVAETAGFGALGLVPVVGSVVVAWSLLRRPAPA